jgi:hypothetical protein
MANAAHTAGVAGGGVRQPRAGVRKLRCHDLNRHGKVIAAAPLRCRTYTPAATRSRHVRGGRSSRSLRTVTLPTRPRAS